MLMVLALALWITAVVLFICELLTPGSLFDPPRRENICKRTQNGYDRTQNGNRR